MKQIRKIGFYVRNICLILFSVICLYPVLWTFMNAFKTKKQFSIDNTGFPSPVIFTNFRDAIQTSHMDTYFVNSAIVSFLSVALVVVIGFITAYLLARYSFKLRKAVYYLFLIGMLIPIHGLLIPLFIQFRNLHLLNSRIMLAVCYCALYLPTAIFLIEGFVKSIPQEIEEAAYIDGANLFQTMFQVIFPMTIPALSTTVVLTFLSAWNEFSFALILTTKPELRTIPIGMANFSGEFSVEYTQLMAASVLATLPVLIVYSIFNKKIVQGMVAGALKG